jgi:glycerol-3-phosphate dehydrogenase (NAD(P)+)
MTPSEPYDAGIVGAGAWGTTLASHLGQTGKKVLLWAFETEVVEEVNSRHRNSVYLPGFDIPPSVHATADLSDMSAVDRMIISVPSAFCAATLKSLAPHVAQGARILSATKGFVGPDLKRPTELLREILPDHLIGVLSGPNLSREISSGLPAISLVASDDEELVREFQSLLSTERFRVYGGSDVIGTELGGALKNIMAIAAGVAQGLNLGENALAALITRGLAEMIKLGKVLGAGERTFYGVSGLGDLICTCQSSLSRNHRVGRRIAAGEKLDAITSSMSAIAEGIDTTRHVQKYAESRGLDLPITKAVYNVLFKNAAPGEALREMMTRTLKME